MSAAKYEHYVVQRTTTDYVPMHNTERQVADTQHYGTLAQLKLSTTLAVSGWWSLARRFWLGRPPALSLPLRQCGYRLITDTLCHVVGAAVVWRLPERASHVISRAGLLLFACGARRARIASTVRQSATTQQALERTEVRRPPLYDYLPTY